METQYIKDRFAEMWRVSRNDAGKSQDYMAQKLGVSKKTIQNWENGDSCPTQDKAFEWFKVLGIPPLAYYFALICNYEFKEISPSSNDAEIEKALLTCVKAYTPEQKRKLLYALHGAHGSSPCGVIEMLTAYLHTPLSARLNIANNIITNYELAEQYKYLVNPDNVRPDMDLLRKSYGKAINAVKQNQPSYTNMEGQQ